MNSYEIIDLTSETPDVSVAMLTYNHEKFIAQAIESVLMQETEYNFKIILADDKSTDSTRKIILEYQRKYPEKIKLILQSTNVGATKNNISLLENIEGLYIAALEGDDFWTDPLKLQKQVEFLENNLDYGLVRTNVEAFYQETGNITSSFVNNEKIKDTYEDYLINAWFVAPCTWLFRKSLIDDLKLRDNWRVGDLPIILHVAMNSKIKLFNYSSATYRILKKSASHIATIEEKLAFIDSISDIKKAYCKKSDSNELMYHIDQITAMTKLNAYIEDYNLIGIKSVLSEGRVKKTSLLGFTISLANKNKYILSFYVRIINRILYYKRK